MSKQNIKEQSDIIGAPLEYGADVVFFNDGLKIGTIANLSPLQIDYMGELIAVEEVYVIDYNEEEIDIHDWPDVCIMEEY